ncbi:MAG: FecR family protein [Salinibacter sp.]
MPSDLEDRLREEPEDVRDDLHAVWTLLGAAEETTSAEAAPETAWRDLVRRHPELDATPGDGSSAASEDRSASRRRQRSTRRPHRRRWQIATGLVLAALVLVGGLWLWQQPVTVTAPAGQQRTATLPDGSTVDLNSGTTLAYPRGFQAWPFVEADRRTVRLEGEAFFKVADGSRAFTVQTATAQVTVTGTQFNVRARNESRQLPGGETEVTLVEGSVRVASQKQPDQEVVLSTPGQWSRVTSPTAAPSPPRSTSVDHVLAWRDDGFAARAQPLTAVLRALERRYDTTLHVHESVERSRDSISLYYPEPTDLETILHDLCTARDLNYRPTSRGFEIFASDER